MSGRLNGKTALISGASGGIGSAVARLFAQEGASVVVGDLREDSGRELAGEINARGRKAVSVYLDVTDPTSWAAAVAAAVDHFGGLTTLFNGAGIVHPGGVMTETEVGWQQTIAVNQSGSYYGMRAAAPELIRSGNGAIVNVASLWALRGSADAISYHATKGAIRMMTKAAAIEFARQHVRVNSIFPGLIFTPINADITTEALEHIKQSIPMGDGGQPEDIAHGALYLCSDDARYVTGAELVIDGGWQAG